MSRDSFNKKFIMKTATTFCVSRFKACTTNFGNIPTTATAFPADMIKFIIFSTFKNGQAMKNLTSKINKVTGHKNLQAKDNKQIKGKAESRVLESLLCRAIYPIRNNIVLNF